MLHGKHVHQQNLFSQSMRSNHGTGSIQLFKQTNICIHSLLEHPTAAYEWWHRGTTYLLHLASVTSSPGDSNDLHHQHNGLIIQPRVEVHVLKTCHTLILWYNGWVLKMQVFYVYDHTRIKAMFVNGDN